mgnify:CR=1 FL=1
MKKVVLIVLACLLVAFPNIAFSETIELTFWTFFGGGEGYIMTSLIEQFNKEQSEIVVVEQPVDWGEYYNKLLAAMVAGNPPDIGVMHLSSLTDFVERGALTPVGNYVSDELKSDYLENIRNSVTFDNQMYALPLDTHPIILYYNKSVLKEAGLVDENGEITLPKTFEEFYDFCKQIKGKTGKYGLVVEEMWNLGERLWLTIYRNLGGKLEDENGNFAIQKDIAIKTYEEILRFYEENLTDFLGWETGRALFISGETGFTIDGVWAIAAYDEMGVLGEIGVTIVPPFSFTEKPYVWGDSHTLILPKKPQIDEEKLKAAATFAEWLVSHSYEWAKAGHLPVVRSVRESEEFLSLPLRSDYMLAAEYAFIPQVKGWNEIKDKLAELGQGVVLGEITSEQAADQLIDTISQVVK